MANLRLGIREDEQMNESGRIILVLPCEVHLRGRLAEFAEARRPVVNFAEIDLVELLLSRPDRTAFRLIPEWASRLRDVDSKKSGDLLRTVRAFADSDLNVKRTARHLKLHTNTIYFRLNRIKKLTGVDPRSFSGASLLLTAMRVLDASANGNQAQR
jgi:sugar diacid utilization regulator